MTVEDMEYALYQLLTNKISYFMEYKYKFDKSHAILNGIFKLDNNKLCKVLDSYVSTYSPFDDLIFTNPDLETSF